MSDYTLATNDAPSEMLKQDTGGLLSYFSLQQWLLYALLIVAGVALRFVLLDMRPLHHDESLHLIYGFYSFDHPDRLFYKYDPMLHGPFLYNFLPLVYAVIGWSEWAARAPIALLGSLFLLVPLIFRRFFSKNAVIAFTAALALSPTMIYWSRFLREDFWVLLWWLMVAYGVLLASARWRPALVMLGITLQYCTKENSFVTTAVFLGYLLFEVAYHLSLAGYRYVRDDSACFKSEELRSSLLLSAGRAVLTYWKASLAGLLFSLFVFAFFFTAQFRYSGGEPCLQLWGENSICLGVFFDALWRKSIAYWFEHHQMERIKGPFLFHIYVLGWYELPLLLAWLVQIGVIFKQSTKLIMFSLLGLLLLVAGAILFQIFYLKPDYLTHFSDSWIWEFFKLKDFRDFVGLIFLLFISPIVTVHHLLRSERGLAFWGYFFTATTFTYSYLGEKVPWLSMYPFITGVIYLVLFFDAYSKQAAGSMAWLNSVSLRNLLLWIGSAAVLLGLVFTLELKVGAEFGPALYDNRYILLAGGALIFFSFLAGWGGMFGRVNLKILLFVFLSLYSLRAALQTNFLYAGESSEYLSQVHTTYQFHRLALRIRSEMQSLAKGYAPNLLVEGDATWPMTTYMIRRPEYRFTTKPEERLNTDYIITNWSENQAVPEGFLSERLDLRGWWVPDFGQITLKKFLSYAITHKPWSPVGHSHVTLLTRKEPRTAR